MNKSINLYPTLPAEWLWRDHAEDIKREFFHSVTIPSTDEPLWHECTDYEKTAYEADWAAQHPEDSPESGTPDSEVPTEVAADVVITTIAEEGAAV